jgi:hypothetical protein
MRMPSRRERRQPDRVVCAATTQAPHRAHDPEHDVHRMARLMNRPRLVPLARAGTLRRATRALAFAAMLLEQRQLLQPLTLLAPRPALLTPRPALLAPPPARLPHARCIPHHTARRNLKSPIYFLTTPVEPLSEDRGKRRRGGMNEEARHAGSGALRPVGAAPRLTSL